MPSTDREMQLSEKKIIRMWKNTALFLVTCLVSVALAEGVLRVIYNPGDYLKAASPLTHRLPPGVNGHDANGFRNPEIPASVDILAVGDSMTYGHGAASTDSYPAHLAEITGKSVYNVGVSGYSPLDYLHLVRTFAPELNPERIVVMLTVGNDVEDACWHAHSSKHWRDYRNPANTRCDRAHLRKLRLWLEHNSMLFQLSKTGLIRAKDAVSSSASGTAQDANTDHRFPVTHLDRTFIMRTKWSTLWDIDDPRIVEGMEIAKRALGEIVAYCTEKNIKLHIAIMPISTNVLYFLVRDQLTDSQNAAVKRVIQKEKTITSEWIDLLSAEGIPYTDLTAPLVRAFETQAIYPEVLGHPNGEGYRFVAEALAEAID